MGQPHMVPALVAVGVEFPLLASQVVLGEAQKWEDFLLSPRHWLPYLKVYTWKLLFVSRLPLHSNLAVLLQTNTATL